jgi:2-keto-3-deoxy-L-rhamnonate aldolase RhmA
MIATNIVKSAAASGSRIRGCHLTFPAPTVIELLVPATIEFLYLDGEHGSFDMRDIEIACITAERCGVTPIARVTENSAATITRFLDRGVKGIVVPHVDSIEDARRAIAATYFAPIGERSFGGGRPTYNVIADKPAHLRAVNASTSLCLMIETANGIDIAGDLATLDGVDYFSFGMMDLCQSLGHPGEPEHKSVSAAVAKATAAIHAAGKRVREDFMTFAWINDIIVAGAQKLLPP